MKAFIYLPHVSNTRANVGRDFLLNTEFKKHLWQNRVFDLTTEAAEFNDACKKLCIKDSIFMFAPLPFILAESVPVDEIKEDDEDGRFVVDFKKLTPEEEAAIIAWASEKLKSLTNGLQFEPEDAETSETAQSESEQPTKEAGESFPTAPQATEPPVVQPPLTGTAPTPLITEGEWSIIPVDGGFALARVSEGETVYRGKENVWSANIAIPDPFATEAAAKGARTKGHKKQ